MLDMISHGKISTANTTQVPETQLDASDLGEQIVEDLSYTFIHLSQTYADEWLRTESEAFADGRGIEEIVESATKKKPLVPWDPTTQLDKAETARHKRLKLKADAGAKIYESYGSDFSDLLKKYSSVDPNALTHAQATELLKAGGVTHRISAHVGSAFDALFFSVPKALAKIPLSLASGSELRQLVGGAVNISGISEAVEKSALHVAGAPVKSTTRIAVNTTFKPFSNVGWCARSIPPEAEDMIVTPATIQGIQDKLAELAKQPGTTLDPDADAAAVAVDSTYALRSALTVELEKLLAEEAEFLEAMGVSTEQRRAILTAFADAGVKIAVRVGGGIALSAAGLSVFAPLLATAIYPAMAATTKGFSNWHETKIIARVALHRFKAKSRHEEGAGDKAVIDASHYMQDHFQHTDEANFHRKIENVLDVRLAEEAVQIEEEDYRLGELKLLSAQQNIAGLNMAEKALKTQREINHLNHKFKPGKVMRFFCSGIPIDFLKADTKRVEDVITQVEGASQKELRILINANAAALLSVQTSPDKESVELFAKFKTVYERRTGKPLDDESLFELYRAEQTRMSQWLDAHADPLKGHDRRKLAASESQAGIQISGRRWKYLKQNLKLVTTRHEKEIQLKLEQSELSVLDGFVLQGDVFADRLQAYKDELKILEQTHQERIEAYRRFTADLDNFKQFRGDLIDPSGQLAKLVLAYDKDIPHQLKRAVTKNLLADFKRMYKPEFAMSAGFTAGVEVSAFVGKTCASERLAIGSGYNASAACRSASALAQFQLLRHDDVEVGKVVQDQIPDKLHDAKNSEAMYSEAMYSETSSADSSLVTEA